MSRTLRTIAPLLLALAAGVLRAQGPGRMPMVHYTNAEGLTSEVVIAMDQTPDGLIWAGTEGGLVYFEGNRFGEFQGTLPSTMIMDLFADVDGALWVCTEGGVACVRARKARILGPADGLRKAAFHRIRRDGRGHLWALGPETLYVADGFEHFTRAAPLPTAEPPVMVFACADLPDTVVLTGHRLFRWGDGGWEPLATPPLRQGEEQLDVARDETGGTWIRTSMALWHQGRDGAWRLERGHMTGGLSFSSRLDRDRQGGIWFDDVDGLWRIKEGRWERFGVPRDEDKGGMVDSEGGIWVRSENGVRRTLGRSRWTDFDTREGLAANLVWQPGRDRQGRLWVCTEKGLCVSTPTGFRTVLQGRMLGQALAPDGTLWAFGSPGGRVYEVDTATLAVTPHDVGVLPRSRITAGLAVDAQGAVWVADRNHGLARGVRSGGTWSWTRVLIGGREPSGIYQILALKEGGVAVLHDGGVSVLRDGAWSSLPDVLEELPTCLAEGAPGHLVVGYRNRTVLTLHRLEGAAARREKVVPLSKPTSQHLVIFSLTVDNLGRIWVGTNGGMGVVEDPAQPVFQMLGMEDRLVSPECDEGSIFAEPGRVWIGTTSGLVSFTSDRPMGPTQMKQPLLIWAKAGPLDLDPMGPPPRLPRRFNELELRFMVPTYQAPGKIVYEARLEGVDPGWVRLEEAHIRYAGLRAGRHVLELRGIIPGVMDGPVRALAFTVTPAWWETAWAQGAGLLLAAGAIWLLVWLRHVALQSRNRQLQEEVARQTQALQEASRAKSAFLANMSHELRTPLNAILLYSELLQEEAREKGLASTTADAMKISQAGSSLLKLIDDILDISKIEAGHIHIEMEEIPLGPFLERLDSSLRPVVERKGNRFRVVLDGAPRILVSDSTRLQQILANLLGNAAKFTERGEVTLTASQERGLAVFTVEDTGIGMNPEEQRKVFGEFVQADSSTTRKYGGSGLGLTLVLRLTEMLQGTVDLESSPGVGTRVTVRIPARGSAVG